MADAHAATVAATFRDSFELYDPGSLILAVYCTLDDHVADHALLIASEYDLRDGDGHGPQSISFLSKTAPFDKTDENLSKPVSLSESAFGS